MEPNQTLKPFNQRKRLLVIQVLSVFAFIALLFIRPYWGDSSMPHEAIELTGLLLVIGCIMGRLWCILYIGDRKNEDLVFHGPYSMSRNPLYLFSTIGAFGLGLMFGSIIVFMILGFGCYFVFRVTAKKEAKFLHGKFTSQYEDYAARVPLFWPSFKTYQDELKVSFSPMALQRTFRDSLFFLLFFPAVEIVEYLHETGVLQTYYSVA